MIKQLTIGRLAEITGTTSDTLRYYEKMRLITSTSRSPAGYRLYDEDIIRVIRFIRGAKALNFTLVEIRKLLALNTSDQASCAQVLKQTEGKIQEAEAKILELKEIKAVLSELVQACPGGTTSAKDCPILDHIQRGGKTLALIAALMMGALLSPKQAEAKPISYVNGIMAMQENDETGHTLSLDYTIDPKLAVGLYAKKENGGKEFETVGPQINTLIKRWNFPDGQGNIFNMTGAGVSRYHGDNEFSAWSSILADYETRRIFTSYEIRGMYAGDIEKSVWQRARVGFAPYLANYDDLNTWFMVQVDHHPAKDDTVVVTPLVRFFYKTTLVEAGYSSNNHVMFNWLLQF
jgi:MerR family Zn(II)-responsive transcriptional regulator of zntA